ncbi:hypothetical protein [Neobacillus mesonae]|uniref:hypothetical protein n=1 Tax=Neobacillus mesonae TaxID=1193713 RepID=UPI002040FD9A|nr:hypothetical protein [Neobacillus mesonae]MCM3567285.1 hypothetical protein [Neobacillus mesonae]
MKLVMILRNLNLEVDVEKDLNSFKEKVKDLDEGNLIKLIKETVELDSVHLDTEAAIVLQDDFKKEQLAKNEIPVYIGSEFEYKEYLLGMLLILRFIDKPKRPPFIFNICYYPFKLDREEFTKRLLEDIGNDVYIEYVKRFGWKKENLI